MEIRRLWETEIQRQVYQSKIEKEVERDLKIKEEQIQTIFEKKDKCNEMWQDLEHERTSRLEKLI